MRLHGCLPLELAYDQVSRRILHGRIIAATARDDACLEEDRPKSAIKLAIERLRKKDRRRTNEEKAAIAAVRRLYDSRIAAKEILHQSAMKRRKHEWLFLSLKTASPPFSVLLPFPSACR